MIGIPLAMYTTRNMAWPQYRVAHLWLAITGHLPWRLMRFFEHGHASGIFRPVGAMHQFRHVRLFEYLRTTPQMPTTATDQFRRHVDRRPPTLSDRGDEQESTVEDEGIAAVGVRLPAELGSVGQHKNTAVMAFRIASNPSACAGGVLGRRQSAGQPAPDNTDR